MEQTRIILFLLSIVDQSTRNLVKCKKLEAVDCSQQRNLPLFGKKITPFW